MYRCHLHISLAVATIHNELEVHHRAVEVKGCTLKDEPLVEGGTQLVIGLILNSYLTLFKQLVLLICHLVKLRQQNVIDL